MFFFQRFINLKHVTRLVLLGLFMGLQAPAYADNSNVELAKKLTNPVADLVSLPIQTNWDQNIGINDGSVVTTNIQPVVPVPINEDWLVISRTIVPLISQNDVPLDGLGETGLGDITQSLFLSPRKTTSLGNGKQLVWGVGAAFLFPTASNDKIGTEKWGAGPSGVALVQHGSWSYGALVNHVWSYAGNNDRFDVNQTYANPFISYTTSDAITITPLADITYNWRTDEWSIPVSLMFSKVFTIGKQPMSAALGAKYWLTSPEGGPEGLGARFTLNFLFPK